MLAWYGAEAVLARTFGWPLRVRSPLFWITRDLLLLALWVRAWKVKGYEWHGHTVDVRSTTRAARALSGARLRLSRPR
jgi:ceramide glucosyltransferase